MPCPHDAPPEGVPFRQDPRSAVCDPPFEIDGNCVGPAAIAEMLLQSQNDEVQILPALPAAWSNGSMTGLRPCGGFEVGITWRDGQLVTPTINSLNGKPIRLRYGGTTKFLQVKPGHDFVWDGK